jgi:hypothetical protein
MQRLTLVFPAVSTFSFNAYPGQGAAATPNRVEDHVLIQRHRIVLVRSRELAKQFPERKRAVVTYPVISGLSNPLVLRRIHSLLDFKNIFDYSLQEHRV